MTSLIQVERLSVGWDGVPLLRDVSFEVRRGEVFAILGGSGCGKSTLLRNLLGLERPLAGKVTIAGHDPDARDVAPPFGVMFQSGALFGSMTLLHNLCLPLSRWTDLEPGAIEDLARARLRLVGLDGFEHHLPGEISGGMKKRAGIARALALEPPLLFLDEPSAGLDPVSAAELDELILTLVQRLGVTAVLVSHELPSIFKLARRCIMLDRDEQGVIATGDPAALRTSDDPRVRRFFNREPQGASS